MTRKNPTAANLTSMDMTNTTLSFPIASIARKASVAQRALIACLVITVSLLTTFAGLASWGWERHGQLGLASAVLACMACWVSGLVAIAALVVFRHPQQAMPGVFLGMFARLGIPMLLAVGLVQSGCPLLQANALEMTMVAYFVGLVSETALGWWVLRIENAPAAVAGAGVANGS